MSATSPDASPSPSSGPSPGRSFWAACRFAVGTLTVFPVRVTTVDRTVAGGAMAAAPFVGVVLGVVAAAVLIGVNALSGSALLAAVMAVGSLAWLTRGLHLDGLADLADGLGSGKPAEPALDIMKRSDIGPFGVVTLVLTLLVQVAVLSQLSQTAAVALVAACATGRLAITWACREGVPAARPGGLGAFVAGTVRHRTAAAVTAGAMVVVAGVAIVAIPVADDAIGPWGRCCQVAPFGPVPELIDGPDTAVAGEAWFGYDLPGREKPAHRPFGELTTLLLTTWAAMAAGLAAAALLRRRAVRRLGGITGDVLGALVETAATVTLVAFALL